MDAQTAITNIRRIITGDPTLAAQIKLLTRSLQTPSIHGETLGRSITFSLTRNRELALDRLDYSENLIKPQAGGDVWYCMSVAEHDPDLTEAETIHMSYWPAHMVDIAAFRAIEMIESDGSVINHHRPEAITHNQLFGEALVIHAPLDMPEEPDELQD